MKTERTIVCFLTALGVHTTIARSAPAERPAALHIPFTPLWKFSAAVEIPVAPNVSSKEIEIPKLPVSKALVLRFQARLHTTAPAGWNNFLGLRWNGVPLMQVTAEGKPRLLNRDRTFRSSIPSEAVVATFAYRGGLPCLITFFGPDWDTLDNRVLTEREEGYWYLLDITDLPMKANNQLAFVNTALAQYWGGNPPAGLRMIVENIEVGEASTTVIESLRAARLIERKVVKGPSLTVARSRVTLAPGGGIQIQRDNECTWFESAYFEPGEGLEAQDREKAPWLAAVASPARGSSGWKHHKDGWLFEYRGREFHLIRKLFHDDHRLVLSDTVGNLSNRVLGLRAHHRFLIPSFLRNFRLAGMEGERAVRPFGWADNPTIYVAQERSGAGALFEDDFFRLHMQMAAENNALTASDEHFGLAPGESYTFRIAIYPTGGDFWDFINAARRDWKVNFTVQGPFEFVSARGYQKPEDAAGLKEYLKRKDVKIFALSPWFEYYNGYGIGREEFKTIMQNAMRIIKSVKADAICIALTETNLVPVPLSFFQGKLPEDFGWGREGGGMYGKEAPPEAAACVDASPWKDSVVRGENSRPLLDTWYVQYYKEPKGLNLIVYPTLTNYRHRQMLEQLRWLLDEVGFDGVYIDQFALALGGRDSLTYDVWDGHTVDLDPLTGEVKRKYAVVGKISDLARREWVEFVLKRQKLVVANGQPVTAALQSLPVNRFMETQGYDVMGEGIPNQPNCARGMFGSPIGLGHSFGVLTRSYPGRAGEILMRTIIAHLRYGLLYYYYGVIVPPEEGGYGPVNHMFPFTPVELHEGYVIGKERIITCRSGTFDWKGNKPPKVLLFDKRGLEKAIQPQITKTPDGYRVTMKLQDWVEVAVITAT